MGQTERGGLECSEVTDGHRVGSQLDVRPGAGKKSLELSDLRDTRGPGVGSSEGRDAQRGWAPSSHSLVQG